MKVSMPIIDPEDLVGHKFLKELEDGQQHRFHIVQAIKDHKHKVNNRPEHLKFKCSVNDDKYEEVLSYNDILAYIEKDADNPIVWKLKRIVSHQGPLNNKHRDYKGSTYNVRIEWEKGKITNEPLSVIAADDPVTCAIYACENNLLETPGWQHFKSIAKRQKKMFQMAN